MFGLWNYLPSIAGRNYMLNVKLRVGSGSASFEIVGEVQITTVDYLQLKKVQHKLYDLDRILKGKDFDQQRCWTLGLWNFSFQISFGIWGRG